MNGTMNRRPQRWKGVTVGIALAVLAMAQTAFAGGIFAWTYTTDLLPKGKWEVEHWTTARLEKEHGTYNAVDFREELEIGVTDNFQVALYLNHHYVRAKDSFPAEDPSNPGHRLPGQYETGGEDVHPGHDKSTPYQTQHFGSISTELIYRILSPYKDGIGLALYMEPEIGQHETEIEYKILLQKNWLEDQLVWALNTNYAFGFEREDDGTYERDSMLEFFSGLSYRFAPGWFAGGEFWNHHEFADATVHEHSAYFAGPTVHYAARRWSVSLGFLHQLPMGLAYSEDQKQFASSSGYIFGEEHEKYYLRTRVSVNF